MDDNKRKLYDALSQDYDMGTFEQFSSDIEDETKRRKLYDATSADYDFGDYESFSSQLGFGRQEQKAPVAATTGKAAPKPSAPAARKDYSMGGVQSELNSITGNGEQKAIAPPLKAEGDSFPMFQDLPEDRKNKNFIKAQTREEVAGLSGRVDSMLGKATDESTKIYDSQQKDNDGGFFARLGKQLSGSDPMTGAAPQMSEQLKRTTGAGDKELTKRIETLNVAKDALSSAQRIINEADKEAGRNGAARFFGGAARGFGQHLFDVRTWDMGLSQIRDGSVLLNALEKADSGQPLTEEEQTLLDAKAVEMATNAYFGSHIGRGYKAGQVTAESIPFMIEMAINPASSVGKSAQSKLTRYAIKRFGKKAVKQNTGKYLAAKAATRALGDVAGSVIMAATTGATGTTADALRRMTGEVRFDTNDEGQSFFAGHTEGEKPQEAFRKAFASRAIENHSEMLGNYFTPILGAANFVGAKFLSKVGLGKVHDFVNAVSSSDVAKLITDFEKHAQWQGTIGEYAEEVLGNVENALIVGDMNFGSGENGIFNASDNLDTFLGVALMGGTISSMKTVGYGAGRLYDKAAKYKAKSAISKADAAAQAAFGNPEQWSEIKLSLDSGNDDQTVSVLTGILQDPEMSEEKRRTVLDYAAAQKRYEGFMRTEETRHSDGEVAPEITQIEDSFDGGYSLETEQEMNDAKNELELKRKQLQDTFGRDDISLEQFLDSSFGLDLPYTEEENDIILDYLNAKSTYDGMIQRVRDDMDSRIDAASKAVDANVNRQTGSIQKVTMMYEDKPAYVIGGVLSANDDGTVDRSRSDESVAIKYVDSGRVELVDPRSILRIDGTFDPEEEKRDAIQQIREEVAGEAARKIDGKLPFAVNDVYTLTNDEGVQFDVQIVANELGQTDNGDGTVNVILAPNAQGPASVSQMSKDEIQQRYEAAQMARLNQYEQEKGAQRAAMRQQEGNTQSAFGINDEVVLNVGEQTMNATITSEPDADGRYEVVSDSPINGRLANTFTADELASMVAVDDNAASVMDSEPQGPVDSHGNPLPLTEDGTVDQAELFGSNPAEWVRWNNTQNPDRDIDSRKYVQARYNALSNEIKATDKAIDKEINGSGDFNKLAELTKDKRALIDRQNKLKAIIDDIDEQGKAARAEARRLAAEARQAEARAKQRAEDALEEPMTDVELAAKLFAGDMRGKLNRESFQKELGWGEGEMKKFFAWWAPKGQGMTVGRAAEELADMDSELGTFLIPQDANVDSKDTLAARDAILELFSQAATPADISGFVRNANLARKQYEEDAARRAEEEAARLAEEEALSMAQTSAPVAEQANEAVAQAVESARAEVNTEPSEAQKKAGNYKMGHIKLDGYDISLENPKGSVRKGVDENGKPWESEMKNDYGYLRGTEGVDGDHIDVFLSDNPGEGDVFVVDQVDPKTGKFDEHKVMYGFNSVDEAKAAYLSNYEEGWQGLGNITPVSKEEFRKWIDSSHRKTKPFAEYASVKPMDEETGPFGPIFRQFIGKAKEAIDHLLELKTGEAIGALSHKDIGDISIVYGDSKTGLAKIRSKHPEVLNNLQEILDEMRIVQQSDNRIKLESDTHYAVISKDYLGNPRSPWLLTAFEKKNSALDNTMDTAKAPRGKRNDTATPQDTVSADKGSENSEKASASSEKSYGAENKLVSSERYEELKKRMKAKLGQLNSGPDPEMLAIGCEMAMYHIEAGARKFVDYARGMISDLGDAIRPYLKSFYNGARDLPGMEDLAQEMDSYADVSAADVNNITETETSGGADEAQTAEEERVPEFNEGDLVIYKGKSMKVVGVHGDALDLEYNPIGVLPVTSMNVPISDVTKFVSFHQEYLNAPESGNTVPETIESVPEDPVSVPESTESVPEGKTDTKAEQEQRPHHSGFAADESISERKKHFSISSRRNNVGAPYWSVKSNLAGFDKRADEEYNKLGHEKYRPLGTKNWDPNEFIFFDEDEAYQFIYNVWGVKREELTAVKNSLSSESATAVGSIAKDIHTKTGADLWVVKATDRVSNDEFAELRKRAKSYGGYYSKFKKGFIFDTEEEANRFNNLSSASDVSTETDEQTAADTAAIVSEAIAVAEETGAAEAAAPVEARRTEAQIEKIDKTVGKVNGQLALLGYYKADIDESQFNEAYGYMKSAEKKAVKDADRLAKQLAKDLNINVGKKTLAKANIAPAGGDISFRLPLNEDHELYVDISLQPKGDDLVVSGYVSAFPLGNLDIMYRVEKTGENIPDRYGSNEWEPANVTYQAFLDDIRRVAKRYLPQESRPDLFAVAEQSIAKAEEKKSGKKTVPSPDDSLGSLFADLTPEEDESYSQPSSAPQEKIVNGYRIGDKVLYTRPGDTLQEVQEIVDFEDGRPVLDSFKANWIHELADWENIERYVEPTNTAENGNNIQSGSTGENEPVGEGNGQEAERADGTGVDRRDAVNPSDNEVRSGGTPGESQKRVSKIPAAKRNTHNNHVERGESFAPTAPGERYNANIAAIKLMKRLVDEGRPASKDDMEVLRKFTGWGGLGEAFNENSFKYKELQDLLSDEELQSAESSRNSAYFTPVEIIDTLWDIAKNLGFDGGKVLEGSAGVGNILASMPKAISQGSDITAVEIDSVTGNILKLLYPDADVQIKGFQDTRIPNNSVDLAITNVPFVTGLHVFDEVEKDLSQKFGDIHDFCIAKNVRKLKEGGLGIFITSNGTLDKSRKLRNWVNNEGQSDFIGAFRLNNETFGGTTVTSDIIVIRKRVNNVPSPNAIDVSGTTIAYRTTYSHDEAVKKGRYFETEEISEPMAMEYNSYFVDNPDNMGGVMKFAFEVDPNAYRPKSAGLYPDEKKPQAKLLSRWSKGLRNDAEPARKEDSAQSSNESSRGKKEGQLVINSKGEVCISRGGEAVPIGVNSNKVKGQTKEKVVNDYDALKSAISDVLDYQMNNETDEGLKPLIAALNKTYDSFTAKYGSLNKNVSISFLRNDVDFPSVAAIEDFSESESIDGKRTVNTKKTDIFRKRMVGFKKEPTPKNAKDGVVVSMNQFGRINIPYIVEKLGKSEDEVRNEILSSGMAFVNPINGNIEVRYQYLSGNVREKLAYAKLNNTDGQYDGNIKELEKVIPPDIPAHLIEFTLGSSWIEPQLFIDFAKEKYGLSDMFNLAHIGNIWKITNKSYNDDYSEKNKAAGIYSEKVGKRAVGTDLMEAAMNNTPVQFTKQIKHSDGTTETISDKEAAQAATVRMAEIRDEFRDWAKDKMLKEPELADHFKRVYNDTFNAYAPMNIDDIFLPERFEGSVLEMGGRPFSLYSHQKKAAIRGTMEPLMLAHEVGSGKTYTLITTAMEMKRLGTARKPMIVVQNATVGQFVTSAKQLYPSAKILTVSDRDRTKEGRETFYAKIKYNDWDLIIVPQSVFEMIPDSEDRQRAFIQEKIDEKKHIIEQARLADSDSSTIKQLEKELADLETEYETGEKPQSKGKKRDGKQEAKALDNAKANAQRQLARRTDEVADFDDMGIDALLIDEAHEYKHLGFTTAIKRGVKGVDPSFSKKAAGVYLKTRSVYDKRGWRNVVFATGTPISNTAAEIWTFMKYLMPKEVMEAYQIYYFDDFVRNFGKIEQSLEFTTSGKFKENTRFAAYNNVPELVRIWTSVTDTVLTKDAEAAKGGESLNDKLPKLEGGKAQDIFLPQSETLIGIMRAVRAELERFEKMSGKEKRENSYIPLKMYGIAKRAAIDPRLVMEEAPDEPLSKTNRAVQEIVKDLKDTASYRGTCAVFCDNYRRLSDGVETFNLFEEIRRKLVEAGVPENQIVIMRSGMSVNKKEEIFSKVNSGEVRVILGSTQTLGTGVNIQQRLHLLIHMDAPDRPMDYTQRNGRILRQGNLHKDWGKTVKVLRFGVEDSLDVTSYQRLKTKSSFIDSIMDGKPLLANAMEGRTLEEEEEGLFDNPVAVLSGSQYALLKSQAEREYRKYENKRKQHEVDQIYVENKLAENSKRIETSNGHIVKFRNQLDEAKRLFPDGKAKVLEIAGKKASTTEGMAELFKASISQPLAKRIEDARKIGYFPMEGQDVPFKFSLDGVEVTGTTHITRTEKWDNASGKFIREMHKQIAYSCPALNVKDYQVSGGDVKNVLSDMINNIITGAHAKARIDDLTSTVARLEEDNRILSERRGKPFTEADKLKEAKAKVDEYTELMRKELADKEAKYAEMAKGTEVNVGDIDAEEGDEDENRYRSASSTNVFDAEFPFMELRRQWLETGEIYNAAEAYDMLKQILEDFPDFEPAFERFIDMNEKNSTAFWETGGRDVEFDEEQLQDAFESALTDGEILNAINPNIDEIERYRIREKEAPKKTGIGYKVFVVKNGLLYPPMVANPDGAATPTGVWLDADAAPISGQSKTGRPQVKAGGKGTQGGSGQLAYRPGWHLGEIPYALQFNRKGDLFPKNFVWAEVEYAADRNYQKEAEVEGMTENGKYRHSYAGLKYLPEDGFYTYRTNPNPETDPWIITGAMKVERLLTPSQVDALVEKAGRKPQKRETGSFTDEQIESLNRQIIENGNTEPEAMEAAALELAKTLGVRARIIRDVNELSDDNARKQNRMRQSKGWLNTRTGEITIVLPNAESVADVQATVLHEVVGHKGLRAVVGNDNFNDFLDKVFRGADKETRAKIVDLARRNNWDFRLATEEYIAQLAESGFNDRLERGFFEKIRDLFMDMLRRAKIALGFNINDNDLRYMLWRSYQMQRSKGAMGVAEDVVMQTNLGVGNYRKTIKFVNYDRRRNQKNDDDRSERKDGTRVAGDNAKRLGAKLTLGDTGVFEEELAARRSRYSEADGSNHIEEQIGASFIDVAKRTGRFIPWEEAVSSGTKLNGRTKESICFVSDDHKKITKLKDPYAARATKGNSPFDIIEELIIHNELFPETAYRLVGITQDRLGDMRFVLEQDFVKYESFADENDIADYLQKLGLKDEGRFVFGDERCAVLDAYGENVLVDEKGTLRFIDPIIKFKYDDDGNRYRSRKQYSSATEEYNDKVRVVNDNGEKSDLANLGRRVWEGQADKMYSLKVLQDAILKERGEEISDNEDAYTDENQVGSKHNAMSQEYENKYFVPMMKAVADVVNEGEDVNDVVRYIIAKHGIERNILMSKREFEEADKEWDGTVRDFSGLTELTGDKKDFQGIAENMVQDFELKHSGTDEMWSAINEATKATLRQSYVDGLLSKDTYEKVRDMYDYYVPLRGWEESTAADEYEYLDSGRARREATMKLAKGRVSIADNPLAQIWKMADDAIAMGLRNRTKQKFLNFALNHPSKLLTVSKQWYVLDNATGQWEAKNPDIPDDASPEAIADMLDSFETTMTSLQKQGLATTKKGGLTLKKPATIYEKQEHAVKVKRGGADYVVYVNGNPRAAQAVNGRTNPDAPTTDNIAGKLHSAMQAVKNFQARVFTTLKPAFIFTNQSRDLTMAAASVAIKEDGAYFRRYQKNVASSIFETYELVRKLNKGTLDMNDETERYFSEFIKNGGETGYTRLVSMDEYKKRMSKMLDEMLTGGPNAAVKAWRGVWDGIEYLNRCAEDATRFAVFMTSRQTGRSIQRSVSDAKEITVNFNRKGSGQYLGQIANYLYVFYNAAIQSLANIGRLASAHPKKSAAVAGTFIAAGMVAPFLNAFINAMVAGDDDDDAYWDLPEWTRRNNFVVRIPFTEHFITIPIAHELRAFYGLGEIAASCMADKEDVKDGVAKAAEGFSGTMPIDFTGNGGDIIVNLTPTIAQPIVQWARNKTYFGTPIYKDTPYNKLAPDYTKAYKSTNKMLVSGAELINRITGGNDIDKGLVDINPAVMEHLIEGYLGGVGTTVNQLGKSVSMLWDKDMRQIRNVPVLSSFATKVDERTAGSQINREYYDYLDDVEKIEYRVSKYKNQIRMGALEYAERLNELYSSDEFKMYQKTKGYRKAIDKVNKVLKQNPDDVTREELERLLAKLKRQMLDELEEEQGNR